MQSDYRNIYQDARRTAGLTQERWAELLGISVDAVRQYETDRITPSDEVALRMAEAAGQQIICYWHLLHKSRVAAELLPDLDRRKLPEAVLTLLVTTQHARADADRRRREDLARGARGVRHRARAAARPDPRGLRDRICRGGVT